MSGYDIEDRKRAKTRCAKQAQLLMLTPEQDGAWLKVATEISCGRTKRLASMDTSQYGRVFELYCSGSSGHVALVQREIDRASRRTGVRFRARLMMPDGTVKYVYVLAHRFKDERAMMRSSVHSWISALPAGAGRLGRAHAELAHVSV